MGTFQKDIKHLTEKQKSLNFFLKYLDISKLRLLQMLNEEQEILNVLRTTKFVNINFLDKMNKAFFKHDFFSIKKEENQHEKPRNKSKNSEIYFIVDAKENDEYSEFIYKKLEESLSNVVKQNDVVVTFGTRVNLIAQKLEFNIIQHFPYDVYLDQDKFMDKIATLVEVGFKNEVFQEATLIVAQQNQDNREIITKKLAPFKKEEIKEELFLGTTQIQSNVSYTTEIAKIKQNSNEDYLDFFHDLNLKKINWFPNISFFKYKFVKSIIKQSIIELRIIEKIQRLKFELHLLDEKKNKLSDELTIVDRWINRFRREKSTEATIILYSAFKLKLNSNDNDWENLIRKKREVDDLLLGKKRVVRRRGVV